MNKKKVIKPRAKTVKKPQIIDQFGDIKRKIERVKDIQAKLNSHKSLYDERSRLLEEILPYFVTVNPTSITINRIINLGGETYQLHPSFFDTNKIKLLTHTWKSVASPTFTIE